MVDGPEVATFPAQGFAEGVKRGVTHCRKLRQKSVIRANCFLGLTSWEIL